MKSITRLILAAAILAASVWISGCASLVDEDEHAQQTPWASPASWEGTIPGMPTSR